MTKLFFQIVLFLIYSISSFAQDCQPERVALQSSDPQIQLDGFSYAPPVSPKGIALVLGGSGFSKAGFGGPSKLACLLSKNGLLSFEWNKRGIVTHHDFLDISIDKEQYGKATVSQRALDLQSVINQLSLEHKELKIHLVGGSEGGSVITNLDSHYLPLASSIVIFNSLSMGASEAVARNMLENGAKNWLTLIDPNKDDLVSSEEINEIYSSDLPWFALASLIQSRGFVHFDKNSDGNLTGKEFGSELYEYYGFQFEDRNEYWFDSNELPNNYHEDARSLKTFSEICESLETPTLVQYGLLDESIPSHLSEKTQSQCEANNATQFKAYDNGHAPNLDYFEDIIEFLMNNND